MTGEASLALLARHTLAGSEGGTLHIHGMAHLAGACADVLLHDDGGMPSFLCPADSPVSTAARESRAAVLCVAPAPCGDASRAGSAGAGISGVVLGGHLCIVGHDRVDGTEFTVVGLRLRSIVVEIDDPDSPAVIQREVTVDEYRLALPDPVTDAAARILAHANDAHGAQLRTFVAGIRGVPTGEIAAAELCALDVAGVDVRWLDRRGAHTARVVFPTPAAGPADLADRLRDVLVGSCG